MSTISIIYRKDKLNKKGEAPIHFRIIKNRKISYISAGIMLPEDYWDFKNNKVKPKHPNSARLNSQLSNRHSEIQDKVFEFVTSNKSPTSRQIKDAVFGKKPIDFFEFAKESNEMSLSDGKIGSYDKNRSIIAKLEKYSNDPNLSFHDITSEFLMKYEKHLKVVHGNGINTIHKDLKYIRKLFNEAYRQELIEHQTNPFLRFKLKTQKTERLYLTEDELILIENLDLTQGTRIELHRDMFVFASYTGGIRVSDILQMQWKHFDGTNINFKIKKTSTQMSIKVPNKAIDLIQKYKPDNPDGNAFLFPMLPQSLNLNDAIALDGAISSANAYINKNLKIIAQKAGIDKKISFHMSRHTWATRALRKGISIDKVSKLMGHSAIKETQIYAKIVSSELDKAMDVFND